MRFFVFMSLLVACDSSVKVDVPDESDFIVEIDADGDGYLETDDCDDQDSAVFPGAIEVCDAIDNNCDGEIDEGVSSSFFLDIDEDGFGNSAEEVEACEAPEGYVPNGNDCDDENSNAYPGNTEICDGLDNNCNEAVDEEVGTQYYFDGDEDGFGDSEEGVFACEPSSGFVENASDCDDENNTIYPDAEESCDGLDNDCDGEVDEDVGTLYYLDLDGDGYGNDQVFMLSCSPTSNYVTALGDCDDIDPNINPTANEICDSEDNNCDGLVDDSSAFGQQTFYSDLDGDGYGDPSSSQEQCDQPQNMVSNDSDCDDTDADVNLTAVEYCDGIDNDCDGLIDSDDSSIMNASVFGLDQDGDGYGSGTITLVTCSQPSGYVSNTTDCDDLNSTVNIDSPEVCDGLDNDCDGDIDDADSDIDQSTFLSFYPDYDGDGFGDFLSPLLQCSEPTGYTTDSSDCDDYNANINPLALWYLDYDGDGYGDDNYVQQSCVQPYGYIDNDLDCDDSSSAFSPATTEGCDGEDRNCDGLIDNDSDGDGYSDATCGGDDCNDSDSSFVPEFNGGCAMGESCVDILNIGRSLGSDVYLIDPDGYGTGVSPFDVYCDMSTDNGGWTQIVYVQAGEAEGYSHDYASVFSGTVRGVMGAGSYKLDSTDLLQAATELRYSEPSSMVPDSQLDYWLHDYSCEISNDVLSKINNPGFMNQIPAAVTCSDINTGLPASNAVYLNYQGWNSCWTGPRLWIGTVSGANYHGDYCVGCVSTWKCDATISGVYSGPSNNYNTSVAFWLR